jgi:uncharacterized protein YdhG (YjbR/CyaY superfamily)
MKKSKTVAEYFAALSNPQKERLQELREVIRQTAPQAEEVISYSMPAFKSDGALLVWYAAFKNHIGLYPKASAIVAFKKELGGYKTSKGAIQFQIGKKIPAALVKKIVKFRLKEIAARS